MEVYEYYILDFNQSPSDIANANTPYVDWSVTDGPRSKGRGRKRGYEKASNQVRHITSSIIIPEPISLRYDLSIACALNQ